MPEFQPSNAAPIARGLLVPWASQAAAGVTDPRGRRTPSWDGAITTAHSKFCCCARRAVFSSLTQDQRLAWLKELLTGDAESLPYRVAGTLLLLYAQPLTKIAALQTTAINRVAGEMRITLGEEPVPVPEPFAGMLEHHLRNRPTYAPPAAQPVAHGCFPAACPASTSTRKPSCIDSAG